MSQIHIKLSEPEGHLPLCSSHFWGNPDLPLGFGYPTYLDSDGDPCEYRFLCQINLADLASCDVGNLLPHKGLLSFFAKIDNYLGEYEEFSLGGFISGPDDVKVLFFPEVGLPGMDTVFVEKVLVDEDDNPVNSGELKMNFSATAFKDCWEEHAVLAEPTHREWETWDYPFEDWLVLLQVDSFSGKDFNLNFMDCGVLDFLISPKDLSMRNFNDVRAIVLST
ncbi:YwqG family protein [uncultured Bacteroides sp.]|uniref:YwqG family protein n=1 Tax=uncultured Bacteroides sp. TaxID=162156 RepID=UPI002629C582|nr:YwqG family protein [uncultured Bacteroides sp.]